VDGQGVPDGLHSQVEDSQMIGLPPPRLDLPSLLSFWAEHRPEHPALIWDPPDGPVRQWTYERLWHSVRRLAAGLRDRGVTMGDRLLVHADNSPEFVLSWLACGALGAVAVTTNTRSVLDELSFFIESAGCVAAVTQPRYASLVEEAGPDLKWLAVADEQGESGAVSGAERFESLFADELHPGRRIEPMLPFGIMFTSGTTSRPKAVVHTHANAVWSSRMGPRNVDIGPADRYLIHMPFFHNNAQSWSFYPVLGVGATAVVVPKWSTSRFWDVVTRQRITHMGIMASCLPALGSTDRPPAPTFRIGVFGCLMPEWEEQFGLSIYGAYGMTETVTHTINGKPYEPLLPGSMGREGHGYEIAIVDPATGRVCPEGEIGELWVKGARGVQLFLEYLDNPKANQAAFVDGWFRTGDMVVEGPQGNIFYRERDKDLLKVGGENVSAKEVEEVIASVPGASAVAVVGRRDEWLGEVPVAFVLRSSTGSDEPGLEEAILGACRNRLADFKIPRAIHFLDAFPTGTLDKVLKNKLRERADALAVSSHEKPQ
jgi:crotonobetaine/carnitine-CoA ligase